MTPEERALVDAVRDEDPVRVAIAERTLRQYPVAWAKERGFIEEWIRDLKEMGRRLGHYDLRPRRAA